MEKMDPESKEFGYIGRKFFASKMWAPNAASPFIAAHLKSLMEYPPRQKADTLSLKKALEGIMQKMESPTAAATSASIQLPLFTRRFRSSEAAIPNAAGKAALGLISARLSDRVRSGTRLPGPGPA